ncbi:hypothetical protein C8Q79DRAFT_321447 [Trametes meyenii]|nr:hypothetical protein C8Q79DRAFT_321447 [Trametes meyenii]
MKKFCHSSRNLSDPPQRSEFLSSGGMPTLTYHSSWGWGWGRPKDRRDQREHKDWSSLPVYSYHKGEISGGWGRNVTTSPGPRLRYGRLRTSTLNPDHA